ncbi:hypothetical protein ZHAS_00020503 [Anopheles sinensis]|uniref:Uncharacterized protein n=1 Tax=Anopheles sinensis TaxID=74873 RepID=A0A084WQ11_ANOSI|nr:hypothetical protein ZHAS_00020503 [Anopheles sinensis]
MADGREDNKCDPDRLLDRGRPRPRHRKVTPDVAIWQASFGGKVCDLAFHFDSAPPALTNDPLTTDGVVHGQAADLGPSFLSVPIAEQPRGQS